jgi:hypothetical protein
MKPFAVVSALLAALAVVCVTPVGAQTLPPSLQGEVFVATGLTTSIACDLNSGGPGTVQFTASGPAFGPYSGTFEESGMITFDPISNLPIFPVTGFQATFTIRDSDGDVLVQGTKSLSSAAFGFCSESPGEPAFSFVVATVPATYQATITPTAGGSYSDSGRATTFVDTSFFQRGFTETFDASNGVLPLDTTGKATGGGQLRDVTKPAPVTFGFEVKQPHLGTLQGRCLINDSASNTRVKCLDVTSYGQAANTATWTGHAEVNGTVEDYRITVQDNAEPNNGTDTFAFNSTSYQTAGTVEHGNIQLHKQT